MLDIFKTIFDNENSVNAENGFNNTVLYEPSNIFTYNETDAEKVIKGQNNTFIVLGRDRPGDETSGYGGKGHMKCGAIDIVAGRLSSLDATTINGRVNPNIGADAARIYLSQKADIDSYYNLVDGRTGKSVALSAIALKADDLRFIARNSLKIVTGGENSLSTAESALITTGVQLIANNDDRDMQPIPKGINLQNALNDMLEKILELNGIVQGFMETQKKFNQAVANHTHLSPFYGLKTSPSIDVQPAGVEMNLQLNLKVEQGLKLHTNNLMAFRSRYLLASSNEYINSAYHFLN
jgi:hypothetical protein